MEEFLGGFGAEGGEREGEFSEGVDEEGVEAERE